MEKKVIIIEENKQQAELFANYLKGKSYEVRLLDNPEQCLDMLAKEIIDILVMNIYLPFSLSLCRTLKNDPKHTNITIVLITPKEAIKEITSGIKAGVYNFIVKSSEKEISPEEIKIFHERVKVKGKKVFDLNFINFLIRLTTDGSREDFFIISEVIFNHLLLDRFKPVLGETSIILIMKQIQNILAKQYKFIGEVKFEDGRFSLYEVNKASKDVSIRQLNLVLRDYIYAFVHMVRLLTSDILIEHWDLDRKTWMKRYSRKI